MKTKKLCLVIFLAAALTTGCDNRNVSQITPTSSGRIHLPTIAEKYNTSLPSRTNGPSSTPNSTEILLATSASIREQAWMASLHATMTSIAQFPEGCPEGAENSLTSPNQEWLAINCFIEGEFRVVKRDNSKIWRITYENIFGNDENYPSSIGGVHPVYWSKDNRYLYYEIWRCCWDPGCMLISTIYNDLQRLDVITGERTTILNGGPYFLSFSPTGTRLAYVVAFRSPIELNILDLKTGKVQSFIIEINKKYRQAGRIVWSPDGKKLVVLAAYGSEFGDYETSEDGVFSLVSINLDNLSQKVNINDSSDWILPIELTNEGILTYSSTSNPFDRALPTIIIRLNVYNSQTSTLTPIP